VGAEDGPGEVSKLKQGLNAKSCTVAIDQAHQEYYSDPADYSTNTGWGPATDILVRNGYSWSANADALTSGSLKTARMWVIAEPTTHFSDGEVSAVEAFVARGGGLLLLTDFNVEYMNPVAERFGIKFTGVANAWQRITEFHPHPVTDGLASVFWAYGASLSYTGTVPAATIATFGGEPVMTVVEYGKGRVVGIADNEVFARYGFEGIFDPEPNQPRDNERLLLNIAAWLTGCGPKPDMVRLCHKAGPHRVDIEVDPSAAPAHLEHGDTRGPCR
jgi:hypothetical protein